MTPTDAQRAAATVRRFLARSNADVRHRTAVRGAHLKALVPALAAHLRAVGATQVWVFGSLVWGGLHPDSDLDLAVLGLPPGGLIDAYEALWRIAGEPVDLVLLETCVPELRERIFAAAEEVAPA